ncbi:Ig-like domain-containing protein [Massilia violaceinigra]|uniref:Ig-like domain-containing protein n=1 Tax=Massilia violaceinigra TaxID=2045208 RepID=A0ABY4AE64_9BURK|nr:Ig-like domain-containing protein [Massilia violaceinigra]UOD32677.1 Ig-like domain-containing protein [Massilia violaceinigra]
MLPTYLQRAFANPVRVLTCVSMATALVACGGGGGNPGGTTAVTPGTPTNPTPGTPTPTTPVVPAEPKMTVQLVDAAGLPISTLSGGQAGQVKVTLLDAKGNVAPNEVVKFTADETLLQFTPVSGSALTDASGVAVITVKPASVTSAGAVNINVVAVAGGKTVNGGINLAVGAAPLTLGTIKFVPERKEGEILPAFGTAVLQIPITTGNVAATTAPGLTINSLCTNDGTATIVPGALDKGMQSVTYTNKGCLRETDTITVSLGNFNQTIKINVGKANIGTIQFVGSDLAGSSIVLRGSGGLGRKESSILTFRVLDQNSIGLPGVDVTFTATTTTGGLIVQPSKATSDASGNVTTTVASGTIPTPVRVVAQASRNGTTISGLSDSLIISTGLPIQKSMSLSADSYNIDGLNFDNSIAKVTVLMADQYGNPISDDTAVNFVTEGGAIATPSQGGCKTKDGGCTVELKSQAFRPVNGRVTVLAYVQGIEDFIDANGDGVYTCPDFTRADPKDITTPYRPLIDTCKSGGEIAKDQGDPFLNVGNLAIIRGNPGGNTLQRDPDPKKDRKYNSAIGDLPFPYNRTAYSVDGNGQWGLNYIWRETEIVFSGDEPTFIRQFRNDDGSLRDWTTADGPVNVIAGLSGTNCSNQVLFFRIVDVNNNPLPSGTTVTAADADKVQPGSVSPNAIPATSRLGGTEHWVSIKKETNCAPGEFSIKTTTPRGKSVSSYLFKSG